MGTGELFAQAEWRAQGASKCAEASRSTRWRMTVVEGVPLAGVAGAAPDESEKVAEAMGTVATPAEAAPSQLAAEAEGAEVVVAAQLLLLFASQRYGSERVPRPSPIARSTRRFRILP